MKNARIVSKFIKFLSLLVQVLVVKKKVACLCRITHLSLINLSYRKYEKNCINICETNIVSSKSTMKFLKFIRWLFENEKCLL